MDATLQARCDAFLDGLLPQLRTAQAARAESGYWQGAPTPANWPTRTVRREPDLTACVLSHKESWADLGLKDLPAAWPCTAEVHTYDGPMGRGWLLVATVRDGTEAYRRILNEGPETAMARDWTAF